MKTTLFSRLTQSMRLPLVLLAATLGMTLASIAEAQQAYVYTRTSLRAGPDRGYPQVAWLSGGSSVYVNGCVRGYHWCDVTAGGVRGWANARHLQYYYQNRRVAIYGNGATYGFPIVGFTVGSYWDNHYRDRPWYGHRSNWNSWHPGTPAPRYDGYVSRPHVYSQPHAVAPRPHIREVAPHRPYVREAAPQQFQQQPRQHQQSAPVQHNRAQHRERATVQERSVGPGIPR